MNKVAIIFLAVFILTSCNQKDNGKRKVELKKYDENGKLIVYSEEEYAKMWTKNRKLRVTVIDTFCINQKYRAIKDIKNGKLIYYGYHPLEFKKLTKMLSKYGIETKEYLGSCIRMGVFEPDCYQKEMWNEIEKRYGENFVDSLFKIAQKEYILENPNVEYIEDGIDLREKYLTKKKQPLTAVTRNGEKCAKFTFFFRKKFYLSRKYAVPKFATSCSRETLAVIFEKPRKINTIEQ